MSKLLQDSAFFCLAISLIGYEIGIILRQKTKLALCNPLLISIVFVIIILKVTNIKYEVYEDGSSLLSYLLTPSTVCLAIPLHQQMGLLKKNMKAILAGILSGVFTSLAGVWVFSMLFHLDKKIYATLLPKSITTAIGMGVSEEAGGIVTMTIVSIILTGILGNIVADGWFKLVGIKEPIAKGLALGTSAHAIGTAKALELGEV